MIKTSSPSSILEFGSTHIRLGVYDKYILNQSLFYEEKINYEKNENLEEDHPIDNLIRRVEKDVSQHLNEIILMMDSPSIYSLDFSIQKNYDKKIISNIDLDHIINECENIIKINNREKEIIHILKTEVNFDGKTIDNLENISQEASKVTIELKFILISKKIYDFFKTMLLKKHISLKNVFCTSYIKSLGLINKIGISGYSSFIDIGLNKSSLTIFKDDKLLYLSNTHVAGDHITKDIAKVLKVDYRKAESQKLKFSENNELKKDVKENNLLKKIINSRLEEIIELLFLNCPLVQNKTFDSNLKLFFIGNGSRALNENLLSFGNEFNFIADMSIINEEMKDGCNSALKYIANHEKTQTLRPTISIENKGFFEKLFEYFARN
tara:strand:- start:815 stop:1957 length:1143 start_codon:yes stop_codon:yes gene_type:complete